MPAKKSTTMEEIFAKTGDLGIVQLRKGDVLEGTVVQVTETGALVDVGAKTEGIVPQAEIKGQDLKVGDTIFSYVLTPEDRRRGQLILSLSKARAVKSWTDLEDSLKNDETLEGTITGHNKGGYIVDVAGLAGFVPFSHIENAPDLNMKESQLQEALDKAIGEVLKIRLIELDREKNRIIFSEKEAKMGESLAKRKEVVAKLAENDVVQGEVTAIMPYGLMVDVGGLEGLVPLEEIGWDEEAIAEALAEFEIGSKVEAKVIEVDSDLGKVKLSTRQISSDPWEELVKNYNEGDKTKVKVAKITSYGVFADLDGVEGMIGLSSIPEDLEIGVGEEISISIEKLDAGAKRLDLTYSA